MASLFSAKVFFVNFNWLLVERILRIVGGLFVTVWVARYLGPNDFGTLSYALVFIAFFSWVSHLGLNDIVVRELTKFPDKTGEILGSAFSLKLIGSLLSVILVFLAIKIIMPENKLIVLAVMLASLAYIFRSFDVIDYYYKAKVLSKYTTFARSPAYIAVLGIQIYLIIQEYPVLYFVGITVVDAILAAILMMFFYKKTGHGIKGWSFHWPVAKELLAYGWPLMASVFLISIHMKIDQIMIGSMLSISDVGIYSVAVKLSSFWFFIPSIIVATVMPYFIDLREKNADLYKIRLMQFLSGMFWIGILVGIITFFAGEQVITFIFGYEYAEASGPLIYNIWGGVFIAQGLAAGIWILAENRQIYKLYVQVLAAMANVLLNASLIPVLGITGAAISTLLTYFLATWVFGFIFRDLRSVTWMMLQAISPHYGYQFIREKLVG